MQTAEYAVELDRGYVKGLEKRLAEAEAALTDSQRRETAALAEHRNYRFWCAVSAWLAVLLVVIVVGACQVIWWK